MEEFGVLNTLTNKIHRTGMSEGQVDSLIKAHTEDREEDKKKPFLVKISRQHTEWVQK